jgi:DNA-binding transcriptional ArsR family regulator
MDYADKFTETASIIGEPGRAKMLWYLLDGRARTATELAVLAGISAQSASNHLSKMMDAGLLRVDVQGRHRYYSFRDDETAYAIEALANLIAPYSIKKINKAEPAHKDIMLARTCYDHLAGRLGVEITTFLCRKKIISPEAGNFTLSQNGEKWFEDFGLDITDIKKKKRAFVKPCIDWTERRPHLAGALGAALLNFMLNNDWLRKANDSRKITVTPKGVLKFYKNFEISV